MANEIILPDMNAVTSFVNSSDACDDKVFISNEDGSFQFYGASLLALISLIGERLYVYYSGKSLKMEHTLNQYRCI